MSKFCWEIEVVGDQGPYTERGGPYPNIQAVIKAVNDFIAGNPTKDQMFVSGGIFRWKDKSHVHRFKFTSANGKMSGVKVSQQQGVLK